MTRAGFRRRQAPLAIGVVAWIAIATPAQAQSYLHYECAGGAHFEMTLLPDDKAAFVQLDGKSLRLPKFVSVTGTRYRKSGITIWIKGNRATLRRAGKRIECTVK
jgi:membrane-bound inhibitor of C-type lysozyme